MSDEDLALIGPADGRVKVSPAQRQLYLDELEKTGSHLQAARLARPGVDVRSAGLYFDGLARRDPEFAAAKRAALLSSTSRAEALLYDHGTNGWEEPVVFEGKIAVDQNGNPVTIRKYDHKLTEKIVRRNARLLGDDSWEDKKVVEHTGGQTVKHEVSMRDLPPEIRAEVLETRRRLREKVVDVNATEIKE